MTEAETIEALLRAGQQQLAAAPLAPPAAGQLEAQLLLAHALGVGRSELQAHPERSVPPAAAALYRELLERRGGGEPVAYLTGRKEFWSLTLEVTPAVLVPRPETELLVERALALGPARARVADLGTGSGAIALALASERPAWQVTATDRCAAALQVAQRNGVRLALAVEWRLGDWFAALGPATFDLIVCNPPYVASSDPALAALRFEPRTALTPGADALASLRTLARDAPAHLERGGWLILEHGAGQAPAVRAALVAAGFAHVTSHRDLAGHERCTEGQR
ncbi:MAG: peptide chain release factor N(5)-glutamine methyltransferase [Gammaproteobacteria bacterium]|nr:peptide chain release factor N(5)-glutamine methyltransferase [Gammaproteobacteria bacterium]